MRSRRPTAGLPTLAASCVAVALAGCHVFDAPIAPAEQSLLKAASSPQKSATLEIYWVTLPGSGPAEQDLWRGIQESRLAPDLRRRLAINGLRAGVISGSLPEQVHELLNPTGGQGEFAASSSSTLQQSGVWRRTRQLREGDHIELKACEPKASAPLLVNHDGELVGRTLMNAQAFYQLRAADLSGGKCVLSLTPEVRHGAPKPRWTPDETGFISSGTPQQDAMVFADLAIQTPLAPGESLIVTSLRDSPSLLSGFLHRSEGEDGGPRKAILIRVVQAPRGDDFPPLAAPL